MSSVLAAGRPATDEPTETPAVSLTGVTRVFGVAPALVRIDLVVHRGETVLVRGPNGAGKSTLLRLVATAISPTYGSGSILGFDLLGDREEIRRRVEFVGHRTRLYEDLTAQENLRFACTLYGADPARVPAVLERVGLAEVVDERVRGFSQGMRQRVAVARTLLRSPELLLLDEPYAGLDAGARDLVDEAIREARADGRTVMVATHDQSRSGIASRVVAMDEGRIIAGAAREVAMP